LSLEISTEIKLISHFYFYSPLKVNIFTLKSKSINMKKTLSILLLASFMLSLQTVKAQTKVMFYTTMGNFEAELYDGLQPITSNNFKSLVNAKFYDGIIFHRVINGFMIQGGDPTGTGSGGPGYTITDEFDPNTSNIQKTLAMANAGPNTGGSQFFINLVNNTYLNPNHPVFGIVTTNFSVVQSIGAVAVNASDRPLTDVKMDSVRVIAFPLSTTSLNAQSNALNLTMYPNPVNDNSLVGIESNAEQLVNLSLYNIQGILMQKSTVYVPKGASKLVIKNILPNSISNGNYVLIAETKTSVMKYKFDLLK